MPSIRDSFSLLRKASTSAATQVATEKRNILSIKRYALMIGLAFLSPTAGIAYAGLTHSRLMKWVTAMGLLALMAASQSAALDPTKVTTGQAWPYASFLQAQSLAITIACSIVAAVALASVTRFEKGFKTAGADLALGSRRRSMWLVGVAAGFLCIHLYVSFAYRSYLGHRAATAPTTSESAQDIRPGSPDRWRALGRMVNPFRTGHR